MTLMKLTKAANIFFLHRLIIRTETINFYSPPLKRLVSYSLKFYVFSSPVFAGEQFGFQLFPCIEEV